MVLKDSSRQIQNVLSSFGVDAEVIEIPQSTRTSQEAAEALGCSVSQIAKSIVFQSKSGKAIMVIASGSNRIDEKKIEKEIGEKIGRASPDFVRGSTGFVIGGVPPLGHEKEIVKFIDRDLEKFEDVWAAAGTPNSVFKIKFIDLRRITKAKILDVKKS
jgi:prolyl-tRNA editing enzyme YbaK/EbsC (Cys-tRNA(Pro) deacylase)